ncbi:amino acid adenylation domain-containing protein [Streptomyces sp. NPDC088923]|uniref:amino acid adenylation domain-containing protein n=1 Tax=Streptomyces sp. NPDC088923 TaxID=3365913 RepID=UPI003828F25E
MNDHHPDPRARTGQPTPPGDGLTPEEIRATVAEALGAGTLDEDSDLFALGLDSLVLMRLVGAWRRAGSSVTFQDLVDKPVLRAWYAVLRERSGLPAANAAAPLPASSPEDGTPFALSAMQHAYWIGRQDGQPLGGVAPHFAVELDGTGLDPERLGTALGKLVDRHAMLRAYVDADGRQQYGDGPARFAVHDLRELSGEELSARLAELRERHTHTRPDPAAGELFRTALCLLPGDRTRLQIGLDMMAGDALSLRVLLADLRDLYAHPGEPLPPLSLTYRDYLAARATDPGTAEKRAADRAWWHERLATLPRAPEVPTTVPLTRPVAATDTALTRARRLHHWIGPADKETLAARARGHGLTPAAALATAFAEVLAAWSGNRRFLLNLPLFDRELYTPDVAGLVGDFSSSLLLDVDLTEPLPFLAHAQHIQDGIRAGVVHGSYGGVEVLRDLTRAEGSPVLAPVVYTSALGLGEIFTPEVQELFGRPVWIISQGPQVVLDAQVTELDGGLLLNWDVRDGVLAPGVADAAFAAYRALLTSLTEREAAWEEPVGPLVPAARLTARTAAARPRTPESEEPLHGPFFRHAAEHPQRLALVREDGTRLAYGELDRAARRVTALLRHHGVGEGDTVAITLPKGAAQVVAVLGVLAAGACYAPVGIEQPAARRRHIHARAGARVVLTDPGHAHLCRDVPGLTCLTIDEAVGHPPAAVISTPAPESPAYLLFTSGSTGLPKGVEVPHRAVVNTLDALRERCAIGPRDRTLALSALDFDLAAFDLFAPLSAGGAVVLVGEDHRKDAHHWTALVRGHGVTLLQCVPAVLDLLLAAGADTGLGSTPRFALLGGDWIGLDQPARLRALVPGCRFLALGGMTEAAVHSTVFEVEEVDPAWLSVPWGKPLRNMRARVVDSHGHDCPDRVPGELWIAGPGLATGYRGDPERTAERFVEHDGERWYRSGDLARYRPDGIIEFLGRADHQVKIGGHRIELGEVEAALEADPAVLRAVAVVVDEPVRRLAALVTPVPGGAEPPVLPEEVRARAAGRLVGYMVPESVLIRDALPLTPNGKPDRAAVALLLTGHAGDRWQTRETPAGTAEETVAAVWAELLGVTGIGRDDSFFALGGDSLLATRAVGRLRAAGFAEAAVAALFAAPALRDFAARLGPRAAAGTPAPSAPVADAVHAHEPFALTDVQAAYLRGRDSDFTLGGVGTWHYSEFDGPDVDLDRLARAWNRLVRRHGMLRAVVEADGTQRVLPSVPEVRVRVEETDAAGAGPALAALRERMAHQVRDPGTWPLFDLAALRYPGENGRTRTRLAVGLDYLVLDALSLTTLYGELNTLYDDPEAPLPPLSLTFRDYLTNLAPDPAALARARAHWEERLAELPQPPALPFATEPASLTGPRFTRRRLSLPAPRWRAVKERAARYGLTPATLLLAAYGEVLAAWSGADAVAVTLTLFNRRETHPDVHRVLGDFTSLAPAAYRRAGTHWLERLRETQARQAADLDHQDVPAAWLLRETARRSAPGTPAVVFTGALGVGDASLSGPATGFPAKVWGLSQSPQVCLDNQVTEEDGALVVTWDAVEALFREGVLDAMFAAYAKLLDHLADGDWESPVPPLLPAPQREARRRAAAEAAGPVTAARTLHETFFTHAAAAPGRTALITPDGTRISYVRLASDALRFAAALRARGVREGERVAVGLPKGPAQVAAVLGVLAAGAVFVPVGPAQPAHRRARVHALAGIRVSIAEEAEPGAPAAAKAGPEVLTPALAHEHEPLEGPVVPAPGTPAYVIFTSGSTGEPKGVSVSHAAAWNTVADVSRRHGIRARDRVFALSALDFDLAVYDLFGILSAGGSLLLPTEEDRRDPAGWPALVRRFGVTVWNTVPALLGLLLDADEHGEGPPGDLLGLRTALASGDWIALDLPARLRARTAGGCRFVAMGGATEAAVWSNTYTVTASLPGWPSIPYGSPLTGQEYRVVDGAGKDCPDWVPGELWIGGLGLADGYLGDPELTSRKFPMSQGRRWYRTGDVGRFRPGGLIEFLGRRDAQLKISGHRVEAGEVEAALEAQPGIARAAVVGAGPRTARRLVAFAVRQDGPVREEGADGSVRQDGAEGRIRAGAGDSGAPGSADDLPRTAHVLSALHSRLSAHAVPARLHFLDALPLTGNGKVDRAALLALAEEHEPARVAESIRPRPGTEAEVAALWESCLPGTASDRYANFFTAGGDSLAAMRLVAALGRHFHIPFPVRRLLAAPDLAALAADISTSVAAQAADTESGAL